MSGSSNWPPELKTYVNETFSKCTDSNRQAVESELKTLIFKAFENNELWKTDWKNVKLDRLALSFYITDLNDELADHHLSITPV